jgi:hypothetical protein
MSIKQEADVLAMGALIPGHFREDEELRQLYVN